MQLVINWKQDSIREDFHTHKLAGLQKFSDGDYIFEVGDKLPVMRLFGNDIGFQIMTWERNTAKQLLNKQMKAIVCINGFNLGKDSYMATNKYLYLVATFEQRLVGYNCYRYFVTIQTEPSWRFMNTVIKRMPVVMDAARAFKYMNSELNFKDVFNALKLAKQSFIKIENQSESQAEGVISKKSIEKNNNQVNHVQQNDNGNDDTEQKQSSQETQVLSQYQSPTN